MLLPALVDTPHAPLGDESHDLHAVQVGAHERIVSRFLGRFAGPGRRGADAKRIGCTRQQGVVGVDGTGRLLLLRGKPVGDHGTARQPWPQRRETASCPTRIRT